MGAKLRGDWIIGPLCEVMSGDGGGGTSGTVRTT